MLGEFLIPFLLLQGHFENCKFKSLKCENCGSGFSREKFADHRQLCRKLHTFAGDSFRKPKMCGVEETHPSIENNVPRSVNEAYRSVAANLQSAESRSTESCVVLPDPSLSSFRNACRSAAASFQETCPSSRSRVVHSFNACKSAAKCLWNSRPLIRSNSMVYSSSCPGPAGASADIGSRNSSIQDDSVIVLDTPPIDGIMKWKVSYSVFQHYGADNCPIFSPFFYSHERGYKMRLRLDPNGYRDGINSHMSLFICVTKGENDRELPWPVKIQASFRLLSSGDEDFINEEPCTPTLVQPSNKWGDGSFAGFMQFIGLKFVEDYIIDGFIFIICEARVAVQ